MQQGVEVWRPLWPDMCGHLGRILYGGPPFPAFLCCRPSGGPDCRSLFSGASRQPRHSTLPFTARVGRPEAPAMACNRWCTAHPCHMRQVDLARSFICTQLCPADKAATLGHGWRGELHTPEGLMAPGSRSVAASVAQHVPAPRADFVW